MPLFSSMNHLAALGWTVVQIPPEGIDFNNDYTPRGTNWERNTAWCEENVPAGKWYAKFVNSRNNAIRFRRFEVRSMVQITS